MPPDPIAETESADRIPQATRDAIKAAMAQMAKDSPVEEGGEEPDLHEPEEQLADEADKAPDAEPPPAKPAEDARFAEAWQKLQTQAQEVEEKSRKLRDLESRRGAIDEASSDYQADRIAALRKLVAGYIGTDDQKAIDAEVQSLYEDLTGQILGTRPKSGSKPAESSQLRREFAELKRQHEAEKAQREQERAEADRNRQVESAVATCSAHIQQHPDDVPYLSAFAEAVGEEPGQLLWKWVERARDAGETSLTLEQVAHRANEWSQQLAEKFRTLLSPEQGSSSPTIAKLTPTPKPGTRKTLPTTRATETPARQPQAYNPDHSVARSDAFKLMRRMAPKKADDE